MKSLSSVARHAADPRTAALAAERIQDPAELLNVATKTEHKDAGVSALERAAIRVADGSRHARRARGPREEQVGRQARRARWCRPWTTPKRRSKAALEAAPAAGRRRDSRASKRWRPRRRWRAPSNSSTTPKRSGRRSPAGATHEITAADRGRFDAAVAAARAILEREAQERAEQERREAELAAGRASARTAMCERVEAIHGDDALDRLAQARSEWEGLPAGSGSGDARARSWRGSRRRAAARRTRHENRQESAQDQRAARRAVARGRAARRAGRQPRLRVGRGVARVEYAPRQERGARRGGPAALHRGRNDRPRARRGEEGGRREGAPPAGAAHRPVDRARAQARRSGRPHAEGSRQGRPGSARRDRNAADACRITSASTSSSG